MKPRLLALLAAGVCMAAPPPAEITIHADRVFPESATSSADGSIYVGSVAKRMIFKAAPGAATAEPWVVSAGVVSAGASSEANELNAVLGVFADDRSGTLWACSTVMAGPGVTALKAFDLKTGAAKGSYPFPGGKSVCNDIAIGPDGTAYVTDTANPRILRLNRGGAALELWATDTRFDSLDGIAFANSSALIVNTVRTGHLFRVDLGKDGLAGKVTQLELSRPLEGPDGMRANGNNELLLCEGAGRLSRVSLDGDQAKIDTLKGGFDGSTAVARVGNVAWVLEAKPSFMMDPKKKDQDPGPFKLYAVSLGK